MLDPQEFRAKLGGVIAFPVTPFSHADLSLDLEAYRKNLRELLEFPLCAVVAAGGTGEMYSLTLDEYEAVVKATVEECGDKMPVIAGVGYNHTIASAMAKQSRAAGADAILCLPPYYPNAHPEGLHHYYQSIADSVDAGILIYSRDWVDPTPAEVARLAENIPNLVAWKDGTANLRRYQMIQERLGDRLHWIGGAGDDMVPGYYSMGIRTYTSSICTIAPRLSLQLHERASMLDGASLSRLMSKYVLPLYAIRARRKGYEVSVMKFAMECLGKPAGPVRPPLVEVRPEERNEIKDLMARYEPVL